MRSRRSRRRDARLVVAWACAALSCAGTVCPFEGTHPPPGALSMGFYRVDATPAEGACALAEVKPAAFSFDVALSANPDAGETFLTLSGGASRAATWDGQVVRATEQARRYFRQCAACVTRVEESIELALLSRSQSQALGGACPAAPLDGGVPTPDDAGITPPGLREEGFDALLACGELRTRVLVVEAPADGGACPEACSACDVTYTLSGVRR